MIGIESHCAIGIIVVLLAVGGQCQYYQIAPSLEQQDVIPWGAVPPLPRAQLLSTVTTCTIYGAQSLRTPSVEQRDGIPWSTIPKSERAFGLFYYLIFSNLLTSKITSTTTSTSTAYTTTTVTGASTVTTTSTSTTYTSTTSILSLVTCTVSTASVCAGRRRRQAFYERFEHEEPMLIEEEVAPVRREMAEEALLVEPSAIASIETTAAPDVEPVQRQARSPQYYGNYWGHGGFLQPQYYPVVYQPQYFAPVAPYPKIRGSQSLLFRHGYPSGSNGDFVPPPALDERQFSRVTTTIYVTTTSTVTSTTSTTTTTTSTVSALSSTTVSAATSVTPTCLSTTTSLC